MSDATFVNLGEQFADTTSTSRVSEPSSFPVATISIFFVVILLGLFSGYLLSMGSIKNPVSVMNNQNGKKTSTASVMGSDDLTTFKDVAIGVLQTGGISGEGQYHLVRPGGDSQNVYLTSSIVDLSLFVGKTVKVNGQTQKAKYAGWLMDVGRVEVLE